MERVIVSISRLVSRTDAQDLLEYGLLAALIAIVALAATASVGSTINSIFWQPIAQNF
jgi:Flp pilus assembly pilin Flp